MTGEQLSESDLIYLNRASHGLLTELTTNRGTFASSALGWNGPYHAFFARDGAITNNFTISSVPLGGDRRLATIAFEGEKTAAREYTGKVNEPSRGEEVGKREHEHRTELNNETSDVQHAAATNEKPWYVDADGVLRNWDTADGTSHGIVTLLRGQRTLNSPLPADVEASVKSSLGWIMNQMGEYDGLVGFTGAGLQPGRIYSGLHNQSWQDSEDAYQTANGENAPHPIKDVLVNAMAWAALREGGRYFSSSDPDLSRTVLQYADDLKELFNHPERGFLVDDEHTVLAQAIDGTGTRLTQSGIDQGSVLYAFGPDGELIVDKSIADKIVKKMLAPDMFNPMAGIRMYSLNTTFNPNGTKYHADPYTLWPYKSGEVAYGMEQAGYQAESDQVKYAFLNVIHQLDSNIEMFVEASQDRFEPWSHPDHRIGQMSSLQQAWTAGAVYWATSSLLSRIQQRQGKE